jgi:uncharacterized protein
MSRMIRVKVHPKSRQSKVEHKGGDEFEVWTPAAPDKGAANAAVAKLLGIHLGVAPSTVQLKRGAASRTKVFEVG